MTNDSKNLPYILALNRMPLFTARILHYMIDIWPDLGRMFQASSDELLAKKLPDKLIHAIKSVDFALVEQDLKWHKAQSNRYLISCLDDFYPPLLKETDRHPPILYAEGIFPDYQKPTVAMVGTRNPSTSGIEMAWRLSKDLSEAGVTIVSGLALGIDTEAHEGCLAGGGYTIAILGSGINRIYPTTNQVLAKKIIRSGLILSEFPLNSPPRAGHFPLRNRIISGMSSITVIVEATLRSGSLITARCALEQNRDVLAVPGALHNPKARGCLFLLQQGAKLVMSSKDVFDELGIFVQQNIENKLASSHGNLVKCMGYEMIGVDEIVKRSHLSMQEVMSRLSDLEAKGEVVSMLGKYVRVVP